MPLILTVVPMLLMIAGGIALAQAVSDPAQVTLRWLRLGGLVALGLLTVTGLVVVRAGSVWQAVGVGLITVPFVVQLLTVQMAHRRTQRIAAVCGVLLLVVVLAVLGTGPMGTRIAAQEELSILLVTAVAVTASLSAGLMGGFIMTMLLGHAYLTAGNEMTQAPFRRLVRMLGILLALRMGESIVFGKDFFTIDPAPPADEISDPVELERQYLGLWSEVPAGEGFTGLGRQILHCTFGSVLTDTTLGPRLHDLLETHQQTYTEVLADHFQRHLDALQAGLATAD